MATNNIQFQEKSRCRYKSGINGEDGSQLPTATASSSCSVPPIMARVLESCLWRTQPSRAKMDPVSDGNRHLVLGWESASALRSTLRSRVEKRLSRSFSESGFGSAL
ncbi:hypothetical protein CR513_18859, partial [Mucuna pruriens]